MAAGLALAGVFIAGGLLGWGVFFLSPATRKRVQTSVAPVRETGVTDVVILGAGPAGLGAALGLARQGYRSRSSNRAITSAATPEVSNSRGFASTTAATAFIPPPIRPCLRWFASCSATTCSRGRDTDASTARALDSFSASSAGSCGAWQSRASPPASGRLIRKTVARGPHRTAPTTPLPASSSAAGPDDLSRVLFSVCAQDLGD